MAKKRLPGMEPEHIPDLTAATETYYEAMQQRLKKTAKEKEAKQSLNQKMIENGLERYETPDGLVVTLTAKSNVRVEKKDAEQEGGDAE